MESVAVTPASEELLRVEQLMTALKPVYVGQILRAFRDSGLSPLPTEAFNLEEMSQRLKIIPARRRILARMLAILSEDGIVERTADRFRFTDFLPFADPDLALDKLGVEYPGMLTEIHILKRCGRSSCRYCRANTIPCNWFLPTAPLGRLRKFTSSPGVPIL